MRRLSDLDAELFAVRFRNMINLPQDNPFPAEEVLQQQNILTVFRSLSEKSYGFSIKVGEEYRFMMVNSNSTIGRQHYTIAHEIFHLFFDEDPRPHMCEGEKSPVEQFADMFATHLLLPRAGILSMLPKDYPSVKKLDEATVIKMEQRFKVSHQAMVYRLKRLGLIDELELSALLRIPFREIAIRRGFDTSIYDKGNEGLTFGDYNSLATDLFEKGRISEGHYNELINAITNA